MPPPRRKVTAGGTWPVRFGTAELMKDLDRPGGWMLLVDGTPQSYVDQEDPSHLEFEYVRLLADVIDGLGVPATPLTVVHLGGGGCTLPRYIAATRPGSIQVVVEADEPLAELVRQQFGTQGFKLRVGDGREALSHLAAGTSDVIVCDVFVGAKVPSHMATLEHVQLVKTVLKPLGTYVVNLADTGSLPFARQQVATLLACFEHVIVMGDPGVLRGRRFGNLVLAASDAPLPLPHLRRVTARSIGRARVENGKEFAADAKPATDAAPPVAPTPPPDVFARR